MFYIPRMYTRVSERFWQTTTMHPCGRLFRWMRSQTKWWINIFNLSLWRKSLCCLLNMRPCKKYVSRHIFKRDVSRNQTDNVTCRDRQPCERCERCLQAAWSFCRQSELYFYKEKISPCKVELAGGKIIFRPLVTWGF